MSASSAQWADMLLIGARSEGQVMGNGNSIYGASQDSAQMLKKFRDADAAYQSASDAEKESHFPPRHAALMMVLGTPPRTRSEVADLMCIALDELTKDLMISGPVPDAVAAALANCLRAIEDVELEAPFREERRSIELATTDAAPSDTLIKLDSEIRKLDKFTGLLAYLANNSNGKEEQAVFFALMNSAEAIRDALSNTVDKLMPMTSTVCRQARTPQ
jgi:hypothetical protein